MLYWSEKIQCIPTLHIGGIVSSTQLCLHGNFSVLKLFKHFAAYIYRQSPVKTPDIKNIKVVFTPISISIYTNKCNDIADGRKQWQLG